MLDRLSETIVRAGIPLAYITGTPPNPVLSFQEVATLQQRDAAAQLVASFDWSTQAHSEWLTGKAREIAAQHLDVTTDEVRVLRALVVVLIDEINALRGWLSDLKTQTAAATNLGNFQSRVAGLPNMPDRTPTQARNAIRDAINAGESDQ